MWKRIAIGVLALLAVFVLGLVGFVHAKSDPTFTVEPTGIRASSDPDVIARGEYLLHGPMHCTSCHVGSMAESYSLSSGKKLLPSGGIEIAMGPLATLRIPNITSDPETGIGRMSDEHVARVLKHGVGEDGKLRVMMSLASPVAADEDIRAVLSYLRTLPPVKKRVAPSEVHFVGRAMTAFGMFRPKFLPTPAYVPAAAEPSVARGEYLARGVAHCHACHSPYDPTRGFALQGPLFSGCLAAEPSHEKPEIELCPPNLTPHPRAGYIAAWSEDAFVARFRSGAMPGGTIMAWGNYMHMTDADLRSVYRYLRTLPPSDRALGPPVRPVGWKPEP
jgi:hypothetical protein